MADQSTPTIQQKGTNVGIGTGSPRTKLSLGGYNGARLPYINGTGNTFDANGITVPSSNNANAGIGGGIDLTNNTYSVGAYSPIISFSSLSSNSAYNNSYAGIWGVLAGQGVDANWVTGHLAFGTGSGAGISERMRITSTGNVGINTTNPTTKLHVVGTSTFTDEAYFTDKLGVGTVSLTYKAEVAGAIGNYWNGSAFTGTPLALTISNTQPGGYDPVLLYRQADSGGTIKLAGGIGLVGTGPWTAGNDGTQVSDMYFLVRNSGGGISERMRIKSSGNVGIGTTGPISILDVTDSGAVISGTATVGSNMKGIRIYNSTTATQNNAVGIWFSTGPHQAGIASFRATPATTWETTLAFYTHVDATSNLNDATEKMRITGQGNVGINESNPTHKLQIRGAADSGIRLTDSSGNTRALLNPSGVQHGEFALYNNTGASTTYLGGGGGNNYLQAQGGNLGIGTTSPSVLLHLENSNSTYSAPSVTNVPCIYVNNSNSSSSTAHAILALRTLGGNGGNPFISFDINGVQGWAMGIDNADGDKFKLNYGWSSLNSATRLTFETGGNATFSANVTASAFFESSDLRLKSNIYTYTPNSILDVVAKVYEKNGRVEVGYIAQDLKGVLDSAISEREDGYLDLSYRQVHTAKIAALEKEIAELKKQLKNK